MCDLCTKYGRQKLDEKTVRQAMADLKLNEKTLNLNHMVQLVDAWTGMAQEPQEEDRERGRAWEKGRRRQ